MSDEDILDHGRRIAELVRSGNKVGAIKLYRELAGVGLAEAKDAIDQLEG